LHVTGVQTCALPISLAGGPAGLITREGLDWLRERLLRAQNAERLRMDGLKEERRPVIGGGISVLRAVFDLLEIDRMHVAQGALRSEERRVGEGDRKG